MSDYRDRAKRYHEAIHNILLHDWDPIGVAEIPQAQDEYDSCVGQIYGMLIRHEPRHKILDYLWWVETEHMGLCGNLQRTDRIVDRLIGVREALEAEIPGEQ
jgi:hypothetical protein